MKAIAIASLLSLLGSAVYAGQFPEIPTMPEQQKLFIAAVEAARETYSKGANDMAKGAARPARAKQICAVLKTQQIKDWVGVVYDLSTNSDGKGVMEITVGPDVYVKTWNNALSDLSDKTLIEPSSSLFQAAVALKEGQKVVFSGRFFKATSDCVREGSLTLRGAITEPEFIFRFSSVKPLSDETAGK